MKKIDGQFANRTPGAIALTALVAALAFNPAHAAVNNLTRAQATGTAATPTRLADAASPAAKRAARSAVKGTGDDSAEARIKYLHDKLEITPAQEDAWNKVALVMQENAEKITALVKDRVEKAKTMTAVDDLNSYAEIAGAHEDGTKKLIPIFKSLYDSMSDSQKKVADKEFREHGRHEYHRHRHPAS